MNFIRLIIAIAFSLLFFSNSNATCNLQLTAALSPPQQVDCDNNDLLTVFSGITLEDDIDDVVEAQNTDGVTIVNNGTIQNDGNNFQAPIDGSATRNLTVTNNGEINATKRYGVYIKGLFWNLMRVYP